MTNQKHLTIVVSSPDEDGDYRVEVRRGPFNEALPAQGEYSSELAEILPDSKEIKHLLENWGG